MGPWVGADGVHDDAHQEGCGGGQAEADGFQQVQAVGDLGAALAGEQGGGDAAGGRSDQGEDT